MSKQLEQFVLAAVPEPYKVLGVHLRPFCLGHIFLMKRFGCNFASDDPDAVGSILDILLGIAICARTYEEFLEFIRDEDEFNRWFKEWGKKIQKMLKKKGEMDFFQVISVFKKYMNDSVYVPKYWESDGNDEAHTAGAHWTQNIVVALISQLGYSESEAFNMPLSQAIAQYYKYLENNGAITLMNDDELEAVEKTEVTNGST